MEVLIVDYSNDSFAIVAAHWLKYFDPTLDISVGITMRPLPAIEAINAILKEFDAPSTPNIRYENNFYNTTPHYLIILNKNEATPQTPLLNNSKTQKIELHHSNMHNTPEAYVGIGKELRDEMFSFYLHEIKGKEMLGADSCGAECDIP
ncbi:MAG: hypothetical protein ACRDDZ_13730 [Marinifilaceae bacterium]